MEKNQIAKWENLPTLAVSEIQSYLNPQDRLNAGLVCKTWNDAYRDPKLWKTIQHDFAGVKKSDEKAVRFVKLHAIHIRNVRFTFQSSKRQQNLKKIRRGLATCSRCLTWIKRRNHDNVKSFSIEVPNIRNLGVTVRNNLVPAINGFLSKQVQLQSLELRGLNLPVGDGLTLLRQISIDNQRISDLELKDFFGTDEKPVSFWEEFGTILGSFKDVAKISVTLDCLSEKVMEIVSNSWTKGNLKSFKITIGARHKVHLSANFLTGTWQQHWIKLNQENPGLKRYLVPRDEIVLLTFNVRPTAVHFPADKFTVMITAAKNPHRGLAEAIKFHGAFMHELDILSVTCNTEIANGNVLLKLLNRCRNLRQFTFSGATGAEVAQGLRDWAAARPGRILNLNVQPLTSPK